MARTLNGFKPVAMLYGLMLGAAAVWAEEVPVIEGASSDLDARLARMERMLGTQGMLDLVNEMERLRQDLKRLRGDIETQEHRLDQMDKRQRQFASDVDGRLQGLETGGRPHNAENTPAPDTAPAATPPPTVAAQDDAPINAGSRPVPPPSSAPVINTREPLAPTNAARPPEPQVPTTAPKQVVAAAGPASATEQASYDEAFNLLKMGRYDQAISGFNGFLAQYPSSKHADSAQYWLAETYYVKHQFEPAIAEYTKLASRYPQSQRVTQALLKIGYSYHELGQIENAKQSLTNLKQRYPGTTAARLAEERLQRIKLEQQ